MDKIGLVTITYNSDDILQSFLDCVWKQTHNNLVLYVIDNASEDATHSILEKENDSRLQIINNSTNPIHIQNPPNNIPTIPIGASNGVI